MVFVAYFDCYDIGRMSQSPLDHRSSSHPIVVLGATLGISKGREIWSHPGRLRYLDHVYFVPEPPRIVTNDVPTNLDEGPVPNEAVPNEVATPKVVMNYGTCAETVFWILGAELTGRKGAR